MGIRGASAVFALVFAVGCVENGGAPPSTPTGIAQLTLPMDAASLRRVAAEDDPPKHLERRVKILSGVHRQLLMAPLDDTLVAEMFDVLSALAPQMEAGTVSPAWASYIYTTYARDLTKERPTGRPRRTHVEIDRTLAAMVAYYGVRTNPKASPPTVERQDFDAIRGWRDERRLGR